MNVDINKFSLSQMLSNNSGKTSSSGTAGAYITFFSVLAFLYGCYEFHHSGKADIMMYSSANIALGVGLLGYRKSVDKTTIENGGNPDANITTNETPAPSNPATPEQAG